MTTISMAPSMKSIRTSVIMELPSESKYVRMSASSRGTGRSDSELCTFHCFSRISLRPDCHNPARGCLLYPPLGGPLALRTSAAFLLEVLPECVYNLADASARFLTARNADINFGNGPQNADVNIHSPRKRPSSVGRTPQDVALTG